MDVNKVDDGLEEDRLVDGVDRLLNDVDCVFYRCKFIVCFLNVNVYL